MLRYSTYIISVLCLSFLFSCTKELEFDDSSVTQNLVLNSIITPDSLFSVELSETKSIAGTNTCYHPVNGATIMLYVDDTEKGSLTFKRVTSDSVAVYTYDSYYPQNDKTYRLEVSNTAYDDASCETSIPKPVTIMSLDTISNDNSYEMTYEVTFKDSADVSNYYRILIRETKGYITSKWNEETQTEDTSIVVYSSLESNYLESDDPVFSGTESADDYLLDTEADENEFNIFSDELIDGQTYTLDFTRYGYYFDNSNTETDKGEFYCLTVLLQSISYDEYMYLNTFANDEWNEGSYLSEPIQVYSNLDTGTGIFAGFSTDSATIIKGTYPMDGVTYLYK